MCRRKNLSYDKLCDMIAKLNTFIDYTRSIKAFFKMKNDYTDDEYKSLVNINIPDEELPSKKKTTVSRAEVERRKKACRRGNENKRRTAALAFLP